MSEEMDFFIPYIRFYKIQDIFQNYLVAGDILWNVQLYSNAIADIFLTFHTRIPLIPMEEFFILF